MNFLQQGFRGLWAVFDAHILLFIPLQVFVMLATISLLSWGIMKMAGIPAGEFSDFRMLRKATFWLTPAVVIYTYFAWPYFPK